MTTPMPAGEPFGEATGEAVQASVMAVRLIMAIADAVRRHQQRQRGKEEELPPVEEALKEAPGELRTVLPPDVSAALMVGADWSRTAQQLVALRRAGVDLSGFLPRLGEIAVIVRDAVEANAERVARESTERGVELLRETLPAGPVREAILSSPEWPGMAATVARLDERGVDVRQVLVAAHDAALVAHQVLAGAESPAMSRDAMRAYGPLTTGLDVPKDLDLSDRRRALRQLAVSERENERFVRLVREALPGREREADLLVTTRQWPLIAARMAQVEAEGKPLVEHLARLMKDTSWTQGPPGQLGMRLVQATSEALRQPLDADSSRRVSTAAARASSTTVAGPTGAKAAAPAEAAASAAAAVVRSAGRRR